jgi:hypothetical protein
LASNRKTENPKTKIPAQARRALCGGGHSLKHSNPKALLSSAGICFPLRSDIPKKKKTLKKKKRKKRKKKKETVGVVLAGLELHRWHRFLSV